MKYPAVLIIIIAVIAALFLGWIFYKNIVSQPAGENIEDGAVTASPPTIHVLSPNGGEVWERGSQQKVIWEITNKPKDSRIRVTIRSIGNKGILTRGVDGSENFAEISIPFQLSPCPADAGPCDAILPGDDYKASVEIMGGGSTKA